VTHPDPEPEPTASDLGAVEPASSELPSSEPGTGPSYSGAEPSRPSGPGTGPSSRPEGSSSAPVDPLKGFRGPVAATLVLEIIVVLLTLLVVTKFGGQNGGGFGVGLVLALAAAMIVLVRFAGRPWVLPAALALQVVMVVGGLLVGVLMALGVIFGLVWLGLLMMRRDVAQKMARGELPSQRLS
jgi:hypothetical protein